MQRFQSVFFVAFLLILSPMAKGENVAGVITQVYQKLIDEINQAANLDSQSPRHLVSIFFEAGPRNSGPQIPEKKHKIFGETRSNQRVELGSIRVAGNGTLAAAHAFYQNSDILSEAVDRLKDLNEGEGLLAFQATRLRNAINNKSALKGALFVTEIAFEDPESLSYGPEQPIFGIEDEKIVVTVTSSGRFIVGKLSSPSNADREFAEDLKLNWDGIVNDVVAKLKHESQKIDFKEFVTSQQKDRSEEINQILLRLSRNIKWKTTLVKPSLGATVITRYYFAKRALFLKDMGFRENADVVSFGSPETPKLDQFNLATTTAQELWVSLMDFHNQFEGETVLMGTILSPGLNRWAGKDGSVALANEMINTMAKFIADNHELFPDVSEEQIFELRECPTKLALNE